MSGSTTVHGLHSVTALLRSTPGNVLALHVDAARRDGRMRALVERARSAGVRVEQSSRPELNRLAGDRGHQGVVAVLAAEARVAAIDLESLLDGLDSNPLLLVLDGVTDPHNLGACMRSAEAAGAQALVAPRDRAAGLTPVARKAASGAAELLPFIQVTNLVRTLDRLRDRGIWVLGAAGEAETEIYRQDLTLPTALVLGAEGQGLRRLTREHCDCLVRIPMTGSVSSLNVSVAAGVMLFEVLRQRRAVNG
jgi:23S rRNA (guanosine2251-2'-O)-methyltransferase